jgi:hypothetical protein
MFHTYRKTNVLEKDKQVNYKICALCDTTIESKFIVCRDCLPTYTEHRNEEWLKELVAAQSRQYSIDREELSLQCGNTPARKRKTRKLTESDKKQILNYSVKGIGPRNISKILDLNQRTIESFLYNKRTIEKKNQ